MNHTAVIACFSFFCIASGLYGSDDPRPPEIQFAAIYDTENGIPVEGMEVFSASWLTLFVILENAEDEAGEITLGVFAAAPSGGMVILSNGDDDDPVLLATREVLVPANDTKEVLIEAWLEGPGSYQLTVNGMPAGTVHSRELEARPFGNWLESMPPGSRPPESLRGVDDAPAGDGIANMLKFALGLNVAEPSNHALPQAEVLESAGEKYLALPVNPNENAIGIDLGVEFSNSLDWTDAESSFDSNDIEVTQDTDGTLVFRDSVPLNASATRFARVVVVQQNISLADPAFETQVRAALAIELERPELNDPAEPITFDDAEAFTGMFAVNQGITNTAGVGQLWNTRFLQLSGNSIDDVAPFADLEFINTLRLADTEVEDISPLAANTTLTTLDLANTQVSNISPLGALTEMEDLDLSDTNVTDVSILGDLPRLRRLSLAGTAVSDISALDEHQSLEEIDLGATQVDNLDPLREIPELHLVDLTDNTAIIAQPGNFVPLQALMATSAQVIFLTGTTGLDWDDYAETWIWVDQLRAQGRIVNVHASAGPITSILVSIADEDPSHTTPITDVSFTVSGDRDDLLVQPGFAESMANVPHHTRITPHPGGGWRVTPDIPGHTPADAWSVVGEYNRSILLEDRPVGTLNFEMRRSEYFVEGILVDHSGEPLEGESVRVTDLESGHETVVTTDYYGHFQLDFDEAKPEQVLVAPEVDGLIYVAEETFNTRDFGEMAPVTLDDSTRIAFVHNGDVHVIYPDGEGSQQLHSRSGTARLPNWSPDGDRILYNEGDALRRIGSTGGGDTQIIGPDNFIPPDGGSGQFLFFDGSTWASDDTVIFSSDVETLPLSVEVQNVLWETTPNGGNLALEDIFAYDESDSSIDNIFAQTFRHPDVSPDGDRILYTGGSNTRPIWDNVDLEPGVWLLDMSGTPERALLVEDATHPSWSPDGNTYAYELDGGLYIHPIDGSGPGAATRLAEEHEDIHRPTWSPDGNWIAYEYDGSIYIVSTTGQGDPIFLTNGSDPAWGP